MYGRINLSQFRIKQPSSFALSSLHLLSALLTLQQSSIFDTIKYKLTAKDVLSSNPDSHTHPTKNFNQLLLITVNLSQFYHPSKITSALNMSTTE